MYLYHGRYWFIDHDGKRRDLGTRQAEMYSRLSELAETRRPIHSMNQLFDRYLNESLTHLAIRTQGGWRLFRTYDGAEFHPASAGISRGKISTMPVLARRPPHLNGKVERSHRVDEQESYQLLDKDGITDDIHLFNDKLREWEDYYNYHRPHGALDGQIPYERPLAKKRPVSVSPKS